MTTYSITTLNSTLDGSDEIYLKPTGINDSGEVVGFVGAGLTEFGFLYKDGVLKTASTTNIPPT